MQYLWLENLVKEGSVRPEVCEDIYKECSSFLNKEAAAIPLPPFKDYMKSLLPKFMDTAIHTAAAAGTWSAYKSLEDKMKDSKTLKSIIASKQGILSDPELSEHKEKASARFDELAQMFPSVAAHKELSHKLVKSRLHSGFMAEDLERLSTHMTGTTNLRSRVPGALAKTAEVRPEVMAHILADTLAIVKEAGVKDILATNKNIVGTLAAITGANLLVGIGTGGLNMARKAIHDHKVKKQLEQSYEEALRQSSIHTESIHSNIEKARQAFETLAYFSPSTAVSPSAARWFMNHMVSQDLGTSVGAVKELSEIERNLKGGPGPFLEGFRAGTEATNFGGVFQKGVTDTAFPRTQNAGAQGNKSFTDYMKG